jgi:hypothetical protein
MARIERDPTREPRELHRFAKALRQRRSDEGLSLEDLARRIHFHRGYIGHVETAEKHASRQFAELVDQALQARGSLLALWERADNEHLVRRRERQLANSYDRDSQELSRWIQGEPADQVVQELHARVRQLAVTYLSSPPRPMLHEAASLRKDALGLLKRYQRPTDQADLLLAAGHLSGVLAYAALDLGNPRAAMRHAEAALACGEAVGHNGLRAWTRGTQSLIARFAGAYGDALAYAQAGKPFATTGTALVRLTCGEAQCYANLGDSRAANHALNAAENIRDRVNSDDPFPGLFTFSRAKQSYYAGSSLIWLDRPEDARRARDEARTALTLWAQGDPEDRSLDDEALAHVYLATALVQLRNLEAALHAIAPVLALPEERRISWISKRLDRFAAMLAEKPFVGSSTAEDAREQIKALNTP